MCFHVELLISESAVESGGDFESYDVEIDLVNVFVFNDGENCGKTECKLEVSMPDS